ncbi:NAD(P)H-hydrate dehydratase [Hymenobacter sp. ASUV-10]|uniref:Bifunctional NAD(P)H-hydrate repair enzyme n=1 Tax=Hymenobacter aranciens TaxID=3063996 RepID=A0ABT9B8Q2_9BACT|nr:NAD(P)H-hydrate dehydratase [Hymenobacter sp. ASUV-10]MDO7873387.1 NAD(P)H-hydrate dehydratase [Hymenobacter sp. ASUV-10]
MKILSAAQTRDLDQATMQEQGITSVELMERAAQALSAWFYEQYGYGEIPEILLLCGPGNNGGDGLALARLLQEANFRVRVALLPADKHSTDWQHNRQRLPRAVPVAVLDPANLLPITKGTVVVDALFGTGLSRPLTGAAAAVVQWLNEAHAPVLAIDLPSGLFADQPQPADSPVVRATHTVTFGLPKLAMLLPQNAAFVGEWTVEDIGLSTAFIEQADTPWHLTRLPQETTIITNPPRLLYDVSLPRRDKFAYKNTFGHALLLAGSQGKMGAAVLAAGACLRGGVGLLTVAVPGGGYDILQTTRPEAMCLPDKHADYITELPDLAPYQAVGIGPGLGQDAASLAVLRQLLRTAKVPLVLDADALNLLGSHRTLLKLLPPDTVLTPHVGEFARLTEKARDDYHRLELLRTFAREHRCIVVLKGAYTAVADRDGQLYFNTTGNPGMASGGSGDVLTGLLLALRADQRLAPLPAVRLAVLAHGHAADLAVQTTGEAGLVAGDLVAHIGPALRDLTA